MDTPAIRMLDLLALLGLPPLLIFGVYHLSMWFDLLGIRSLARWRRVGRAAVVSHTLFAVGLFVIAYADYRAVGNLLSGEVGFGGFLLRSGEIWQVLLFLDTLPAVVIVGGLELLDPLSLAPGSIVALIVSITLFLGTLQWYWVGAAVGALVERVWTGLQAPDDEGPDWL